MHQVIHSVPTVVLIATAAFAAAFAIYPLSAVLKTRHKRFETDAMLDDAGGILGDSAGARYGAMVEPRGRGVNRESSSNSFQACDNDASRDDDGDMHTAVNMAHAIERLRERNFA